MFLVDENLGKRFCDLLNKLGFRSIFVGDVLRGEEDEKVLEFAWKNNLILITEDKDFGKLIVNKRLKVKGLILFRTKFSNPTQRIHLLKTILNEKLEGKFIIISEKSIRVRKI